MYIIKSKVEMKSFRIKMRKVATTVACLAVAVFSGCDPEEDLDNGTGKPEAVVNLTATAGNAQVSLVWEEPADNGGEEITAYEVTSDNWANKVTKSASEFSHTCTGLTNGTEYTFKVRAVNANGAGAESEAKATPKASGALGDWSLPTNLKVESVVPGYTSDIAIKIGNDYYYILIYYTGEVASEYYLKNTGAHTWKFFQKTPYTKGWVIPPAYVTNGVTDNGSPNSASLEEVLTSFFYGTMIRGRDGMKNKAVIGTDVVVGRQTEIRKENDTQTMFYFDIEYNLCLKKYNSQVSQTLFEVTKWDETITGFGNIDLPE
jgi:hypothetical protein